jgi:hypothetical protein
MNMKLIVGVLMLVATPTVVVSQKSVGWHGLVPLKSTRVEVERILGPFDAKCQCYATQNEVVHVTYATGRCKGRLAGWNVPADRVLAFTVSPNEKALFSTVENKKADFIKTSDDTFNNHYGNARRGIRYSVSWDGLVQKISYVPSIKDNHLRCNGFPLTDGGVTGAYTPYDQFPFDTLDDITSRLGEFSVRLRREPQLKGYVIVYARRNKRMNKVASFASRARRFLIKELYVDPSAVESVNAGYRESFTVELFLVPRDWPRPVPTPSLAGILR